MSNSDIRASFESPSQAKQQHILITPDGRRCEFPDYKHAYLFGVVRWGSGSLDALGGWRIERLQK